MSRNLKSYDFAGHKNLQKFFEVDNNYDPYQELARSIAYGHYGNGINSKTLNDKKHLSRDVKNWAKKNNFNDEQTARLKAEVKNIYKMEGK